jgi:ArsR family transcriptional regulator, arsenate/arsenite/antimonite-responsive transcriptional repressor
LSFHLAQLTQAGLATARRDGRSIVYAADYRGMSELMRFLTENCCGGEPCPPVARKGRKKRGGAAIEVQR